MQIKSTDRVCLDCIVTLIPLNVDKSIVVERPIVHIPNK